MDELEPGGLAGADCPRTALRTVRVQVRTLHVLGLTPREIARAVEWADTGSLHALDALHRG
ncbi:hypothetical protein [Streptomyces finlayi]|uniref:hypothetical protein n=1 Tax=Streptomyces finlayi TaxID=67296 RepID=UPI001679C249|nr:hypothetical protein [Streptomyces finlayi]